MNSPETRFAPNTNEVAAEVLDGEAILINLSNGVYYSLIGAGSFVWSCLEKGLSVEEIGRALTTNFEVEESAALSDTQTLLSDLEREKLVVAAPQSAPNAAPTPEPLPARQPYEKPELKIYSDMQELLALDPPMPDLTDAPHKR